MSFLANGPKQADFIRSYCMGFALWRYDFRMNGLHAVRHGTYIRWNSEQSLLFDLFKAFD